MYTMNPNTRRIIESLGFIQPKDQPMNDLINLVGMTDGERRNLALSVINPKPGQHSARGAAGGLWERFNGLALLGFNLNHAHTSAICAHCGKVYRVNQFVFMSRHATTHEEVMK